MNRELPKRKRLYDTKCFDLANCFIEDDPEMNNSRNADELAARIQETIEDFIAEKKENTPSRANG